MWKESYRIGIERIDAQHMELFRMADGLMKAIESGAERKVFEDSISFLKDYVVFHFRDEEEYQASINYADIEEHKKAHRSFTNTVLDYERELLRTDYDLRVVKDLMGTLTAWLIYHVADADQRVAGKKPEGLVYEETEGDVAVFSSSVMSVLETMTGLDKGAMADRPLNDLPVRGDVFVRVGIVGEKEGSAVFGFTQSLAFKLVEMMAFMVLDELDELVCSVLAELSNITCGSAAMELAGKGVVCDICPPEIFLPGELAPAELGGVHIDTGIGGLEVAVQLA